MTIPTMWPFKWYNGEQTPQSKVLEGLPLPVPLTPYEKSLETEPEEALL